MIFWERIAFSFDLNSEKPLFRIWIPLLYFLPTAGDGIEALAIGTHHFRPAYWLEGL
jgi:hypothetical protein